MFFYNKVYYKKGNEQEGLKHYRNFYKDMLFSGKENQGYKDVQSSL